MTKKRYFYMFDLKNEGNDICRLADTRIDESRMISELNEILSEVDENKPRSLAATVRYYARKKNLRPSEICNRVGLDQRYFNKLIRKNKPIKHPAKVILFTLCFAFQFDYSESVNFMQMAGSSFNFNDRFDVAVVYLLRHRVFDMEVVNNTLYELSLPCIGVIE